MCQPGSEPILHENKYTYVRMASVDKYKSILHIYGTKSTQNLLCSSNTETILYEDKVGNKKKIVKEYVLTKSSIGRWGEKGEVARGDVERSVCVFGLVYALRRIRLSHFRISNRATNVSDPSGLFTPWQTKATFLLYRVLSAFR